jgi:hypothetical protein
VQDTLGLYCPSDMAAEIGRSASAALVQVPSASFHIYSTNSPTIINRPSRDLQHFTEHSIAHSSTWAPLYQKQVPVVSVLLRSLTHALLTLLMIENLESTPESQREQSAPPSIEAEPPNSAQGAISYPF